LRCGELAYLIKIKTIVIFFNYIALNKLIRIFLPVKRRWEREGPKTQE
jgi:hypothetical protein